jgi:hypothetical protein
MYADHFQSPKSLCLGETFRSPLRNLYCYFTYFAVNELAAFACLQVVSVWLLYKKQTMGELPESLISPLLSTSRRKKLVVNMAGQNSSVQKTRNNRKHDICRGSGNGFGKAECSVSFKLVYCQHPDSAESTGDLCSQGRMELHKELRTL